MASSKTATFEKVLQATDLDSVDLPLLCLVYERFASVADRDRVESSKADKKSSTPALVTKTWTFVDTQLSSFPPALRGLAQDRIGSNWQQRRDLLVNYEEDSFCKIKVRPVSTSPGFPQGCKRKLMLSTFSGIKFHCRKFLLRSCEVMSKYYLCFYLYFNFKIFYILI